MTAEQMRRALEIHARAQTLKKQHDTYVLVAKSYASGKEFINVGEPRGRGEYSGIQVEIPEAARRHVFNLWKRETALKYNEIVRELNQIGMSHNLELLEVRSA